METTEHYVEQFVRLGAGVQPAGGGRLAGLRKSALDEFARLGFPTLADEEWKYTSVAPIAQTPFVAPESFDVPPTARRHLDERGFDLLGEFEGRALVFVNGRFSAELSSLDRLPAGVVVANLAALLADSPDQLPEVFGSYDGWKNSAFVALNTAFMEDGAVVCLPAGVSLAEPLAIAHVTLPGAEPVVTHPRHLIFAAEGSHATIVESYLGHGDMKYFTNSVTEVILGTGARVEHYKLQRETRQAFHVASIQAYQGKDSHFRSHSVSLGGALVRNDIGSILDAEGAECTLLGLYMASGRQHIDNHTVVDHARPRCRSTENYKGVLDGSARGVFNGKILVRPHASKTDARQSNRNLLLTEDAEIDTKPQLEIYNDDVKCSHGAAVGQLDEDALFYLRARGIGADEARALLTYAFAAEVLDGIGVAPLRASLDALLRRRLGAEPERAGAA